MADLEKYIRIALKTSLEVDDIQKGFVMRVPIELKLDFLKKMRELGWIWCDAIVMNPEDQHIHLVSRYEYRIVDSGRKMEQFDKVLGYVKNAMYI